jgi:hypothetical protein
METKSAAIVGVSLAVLCCVCGCRSTPQPIARSLYSDELVRDALQTYTAHVRAVSAGTEQPGSDIPPAYWAEGIKALQPLRVYTHRINIVVVQHVADGTEEGKYIYIPVSSYLPQSGDDGFEFTPNPRVGNTYSLGSGIFEFERTREN